MQKELLHWDIYEIQPNGTAIVGVMFRGRIRKFCLKQDRNVLTQNAVDAEQCVRFAIPTGEDPHDIIKYIQTIAPDATIPCLKENVPNPVLSKLKVNIESRYTLY